MLRSAETPHRVAIAAATILVSPIGLSVRPPTPASQRWSDMPGLRFLVNVGSFMVFMLSAAAAPAQNTPAPERSSDAKNFVEQHERTMKPLEIEIGKAWWNANVTG